MASSTHEKTGFETQTRDICTPPTPYSYQGLKIIQYIAALLKIPKLFISELICVLWQINFQLN